MAAATSCRVPTQPRLQLLNTRFQRAVLADQLIHTLQQLFDDRIDLTIKILLRSLSSFRRGVNGYVGSTAKFLEGPLSKEALDRRLEVLS